MCVYACVCLSIRKGLGIIYLDQQGFEINLKAISSYSHKIIENLIGVCLVLQNEPQVET